MTEFDAKAIVESIRALGKTLAGVDETLAAINLSQAAQTKVLASLLHAESNHAAVVMAELEWLTGEVGKLPAVTVAAMRQQRADDRAAAIKQKESPE
jgi:hypothetical protein